MLQLRSHAGKASGLLPALRSADAHTRLRLRFRATHHKAYQHYIGRCYACSWLDKRLLHARRNSFCCTFDCPQSYLHNLIHAGLVYHMHWRTGDSLQKEVTDDCCKASPIMKKPTKPSEDKQCFNCGHALEKDVAFCPCCGAPLPTYGSSAGIALHLISIFILGVLMLVLGIAGGCIMLYGIAGAPFLILIGLPLLGAAVVCAWNMENIIKKH